MYPRLRLGLNASTAVRTIALIPASAVIAFAVAACDSGDGGGSKPPTPAVTVTRRTDVEIRDFAFNPASFEAPAGRVFNITAKNSGATAHTVNVYKDAAFTLPLSADAHIEVAPGATEGLFVKFDTAGTYYFRCEIHPQQMQGQIRVTPAF